MTASLSGIVPAPSAAHTCPDCGAPTCRPEARCHNPVSWSDQLTDALSTAQNEAKTLALLIRRGDNGLGRRLQLETAERRVRVLSGQLAEARS